MTIVSSVSILYYNTRLERYFVVHISNRMKKIKGLFPKKNITDILVRFIVEKSRLIEKVFFILTAFMLLCLPLVGTNYDLTKYLPSSASSKQGVDLMEREFGTPGSASLMLSDVSPYEARLYKKQIEAIDGVDSVSWADTMGQIFIGEEFFFDLDLDDYYKDKNALFSIQFEEGDADPKTYAALDEISKKTEGFGYISGPSVDNNTVGASLDKEIPRIMVMVLATIIIGLTLTTNSWLEPVLFLFTMGIGVIINMGSNIIFGEISFLSSSIAAILQRAVSMDYSVFLLHTFTEERTSSDNVKDAMSSAVKKAFSSITSSSFTTVIGFTALALMKFKIGADMGLVLAKGILCSMGTVLFLMPALIIRANKLHQRLSHKPLIPGKFIRMVSSALFSLRFVAAVFVILLIIPASVGKGMNDFAYGTSAISGGAGSKSYEDSKMIKSVFGENNMMAILIPNSDPVLEKKLAEKLDNLDFITSVTSLSNMLPTGIPEDFLPEGITSELHSKDYARLIIMMDCDVESKYSYECVNRIKRITNRYYPRDTYFVGSTSATMDMEEIISNDYGRVNNISLLGVILVILFTFKSPFCMLTAILPIEIGINISMFLPYLRGDRLAFLGYLMVSSMLLGCTVDYAILTMNHYLEIRKTEASKKEACIKTIEKSILSVMTSGTVLAVCGTGLSIMCSIKAIADIGLMIGQGAVVSMLMVLLFMPLLLYIFDGFLVK